MTEQERIRRILIVDDNAAIHEDYRKILCPTTGGDGLSAAKAAMFGGSTAPAPKQPRFALDSAFQGHDAVEMARTAKENQDPYLTAFVDMRMPPGIDGVTTIEQLWKADPRVQVVVCTAYSDQSHDEITARLGGSDRLVILKKPFESMEVLQLARTMTEKWLAERAAEIRVQQLEEAVRERTAEIEHRMLHDRLTGLPNRVFIQTRIEACIQRRWRNPEQKFALLFLDFDRFKLVNDSLGHDKGDQLLIEVAARLSASLRGGDTVARVATPSRIGGDEFIVLLEDLRVLSDAARVAERLIAVLSEPYTIDENCLYLTCSIGIATSEHEYDSALAMVRDADTAMYRAKSAGRSRYMLFDANMHEQVMRRLSLEQAFRLAVRNNDVSVHFQPIVHLSSRTVSGFEALLRWSHPEHGPVSAAELIELAEETGLIQPLSLIVLRQACEQARKWRDMEPPPSKLMMSVNLSRHQLIDPNIVGKIGTILADAGIPPASLVLEITESTAMSDDDQAERALRQLRDMGVWLHLDDFGTGYSSLGCLHRLPLTGLKIDRTFITTLFERPETRVVLESIVRIARAFQLQIIAEGVETTEQFEALRELEIDFAQGYLFGMAVSAEHATGMLGKAPPMNCCEAAFKWSPRPAAAVLSTGA